jgi:hypothetical protein
LQQALRFDTSQGAILEPIISDGFSTAGFTRSHHC